MDASDIFDSVVFDITVNHGLKELTRKKINIRYPIFLVVGLILLISGLVIFFGSFAGENNKDYANATISDIRFGMSEEDSDEIYVNFSVDGVLYEDVYLKNFCQIVYKIGDKVQIRYEINNPTIADYIKFRRILGGLLTYYGVVFTTLGVCLYKKEKLGLEW